MTAQLYCFGESGHSYKAALSMTLAGIPWEPVFVDFFNGETRSPTFRDTVNVMGECPVLVDGETRLSQSALIQLRVVEQAGKLGWADEAEHQEVLRWLFWDNHKMSSQAGALRYFMNFLPEEHRNADVIAWLQGRVRAALQVLEAALEGRTWIATSREVSIADLSCCSYLFYPEPFGFDRADWPNIDAWLDRIAALPGWAHPYELMPGNPSDRA
ncbi:glutathione S-transferase family protein [Pseudoroseicyclus tamaricis]|uniref:Glutathione S-transferase n=1 Tax=Pseudoroseicyclus tamaricis TaxID=2705421 RepID=A0A6B2JLD2_9RHOB|nr:glutathione S-transferase [Pseudoroseicyclus tamaricis]NDV02361.1 glutathione S-transferase [Pseudoroseicyclus tamaricis]